MERRSKIYNRIFDFGHNSRRFMAALNQTKLLFSHLAIENNKNINVLLLEISITYLRRYFEVE